MATEHINKVVRFGARRHTRAQTAWGAQIMRVSRERRGGRTWDMRTRGGGNLGRKINRYTISGAQIHTFRRCNVFAVLEKILFSYVTKTRVERSDTRIM